MIDFLYESNKYTNTSYIIGYQLLKSKNTFKVDSNKMRIYYISLNVCKIQNKNLSKLYILLCVSD